MAIELGDLHLTKIHNIQTLEQSQYVYHRIPGLSGAVSQDVGRDSVRLVIEGIFFGGKAGDDLKKLRSIHTAHDPVDFIADITGSAYAGQMILDTFDVRENSMEPDQYSYILYLSEYVKPPQSVPGADEIALKDMEKTMEAEADSLMDIAALPDMLTLGNIPELSNPTEPLQGALDPVKEGVEGLTTSLSGLCKLFGE